MRPRGIPDPSPRLRRCAGTPAGGSARRGATSARALGAGSGAAAGPSPAPSFAATLPAPYAPAPFAPAPYAGGLSAGRALRGRALRGSLSALRLGPSPCPPPPPRPPLRWKRSRPGLRPRRGRFCALRPPFGGSPCWRQSCWRVRLWLGPRRGPRPFAAPRRPCAPRKFALPGAFVGAVAAPAALRGRRAPAGRLGAGAPCPRGRHRRARGYRRGAPCRPYARKAPATRGERSRLSPPFLCALRARLRGGRASRALAPSALGRAAPPPSRGPPFPPRAARPSVACAGCGRSQRTPQPPAPRRGGLLMNGLAPMPAG